MIPATGHIHKYEVTCTHPFTCVYYNSYTPLNHKSIVECWDQFSKDHVRGCARRRASSACRMNVVLPHTKPATRVFFFLSSTLEPRVMSLKYELVWKSLVPEFDLTWFDHARREGCCRANVYVCHIRSTATLPDFISEVASLISKIWHT